MRTEYSAGQLASLKNGCAGFTSVSSSAPSSSDGPDSVPSTSLTAVNLPSLGASVGSATRTPIVERPSADANSLSEPEPPGSCSAPRYTFSTFSTNHLRSRLRPRPSDPPSYSSVPFLYVSARFCAENV